MSAFFLLIGISIIVAGSFLAAFLWSVKTGQYDDDYTPSIRILFDNAPGANQPKEEKIKNTSLTKTITQPNK